MTRHPAMFAGSWRVCLLCTLFGVLYIMVCFHGLAGEDMADINLPFLTVNVSDYVFRGEVRATVWPKMVVRVPTVLPARNCGLPHKPLLAAIKDSFPDNMRVSNTFQVQGGLLPGLGRMHGTCLVIQFEMLVLAPLFFIQPLAWILFRLGKAQHGFCVCGYDIRASGERCPECGAVKGEYQRAASARTRLETGIFLSIVGAKVVAYAACVVLLDPSYVSPAWITWLTFFASLPSPFRFTDGPSLDVPSAVIYVICLSINSLLGAMLVSRFVRSFWGNGE